MTEPVTPALSAEALWGKSKKYIARALAAKGRGDMGECQLWASLALELLGRELINVRGLVCKVCCTPNSDQKCCVATNDAKCQLQTFSLSEAPRQSQLSPGKYGPRSLSASSARRTRPD